GDDVGEGGLAEARGAEHQGVVEGLVAAPGGADEDFHLLPHGPLAHVIGEAQGPDGAVETLLAVAGGGGNQAVVLDHGRFSGALSAPGSFGYRAFQRLANQGFTGGALARLPGGGADHFGRVLGFVTEGNEGALRLDRKSV